MRRTCGEEAVGTDVEASTQELERPCINTIEVGGTGGNLTCACWILQLKLSKAGREIIFARGRSWRSPQ